MGLDYLSVTMTPSNIKQTYKSIQKSGGFCGNISPQYISINDDPRSHLIGPYSSLRKIQREEEGCRMKKIQVRRDEIQATMQKRRCESERELEKQNLALYISEDFD